MKNYWNPTKCEECDSKDLTIWTYAGMEEDATYWDCNTCGYADSHFRYDEYGD